MPQLIFGGILAVVMLGFYIYSIVEAISVAKTCGDVANCATQLSSNMTLLLNLVGGLISATVVGVLGATRTSEFPGERLFAKNATLSGRIKTFAAYMPSFYILVWIICGVVIVIYPFAEFQNDPVPALTAQAKAWLGAAIAAVYAYFGITPGGNNNPGPSSKDNGINNQPNQPDATGGVNQPNEP